MSAFSEGGMGSVSLRHDDSNLLPAITTPPSLDLAHLRTALWFHTDARITRFVTMNDAQEQAAKELALPV
jgi:hypothetical protein